MKKQKPMKRTIVIMDDETNKIWKSEAKKEKKSKSKYAREAIRQKAGK